MGHKNQYSSINFLGGFIEGISIVNFLWAISTLLFLVAGKASRVLVDRWITSETFHDVQSANRRCTSHATMWAERGNYRFITVHAPFLAIGPNQKSLSNCYMEALSHWPEMKNSGRCALWNFTKKCCTYTCHTLLVYSPPKVLHHCLKYFCEFPNNLSVSFLLQKNKPTQSATIVLTLWIYRTEDKQQSCIFIWRYSKKRCVHCN